MTLALTNFQLIRPRYEFSQENTLEWIAKAHAEAEKLKSNLPPENYQTFYDEIKEKLFKLGTGSGKVKKRGLQFPDFSHHNWHEMQIYNVHERHEGSTHEERLKFYDEATTQIFNEFYPENAPIPSQLIHVTCTGYVAPSPAQKMLSKKKQPVQTLVTNAYHMGCYASIPAIRMGLGFLHENPKQSVDIVHTEICSLHLNPLFHQTHQLVVQSLFGDGYIKYSLSSEKETKGLIPLAIHEELLPDTTEAMTWVAAGWGMQMFIAKEVPVMIARGLENYLKQLANKIGFSFEKLLKEGYFAIHPGGPKVIEQIQKILELKHEQIYHSQKILQDYGNMSSATLPHVWKSLLEDDTVPDKSLIVSLAFGPGLNIAGGLFEKRGVN
jgi:predicted naringenin-chalcone synthase